jgi:4-hydroxy-3-methylbut-2-enyl diphosphate reductase
MARVKLAKTAGFCMGVRRAMDMALEAILKKNGSLYTYGPLIHNPQVLQILKDKGLKTLEAKDIATTLSQSPNQKLVTVIIRAHGLPPEEYQKIKNVGVNILNATCPHVGKVQGIIKRYAAKGYNIIILGEKDHAEVIGLLGFAQGRGYIINSLAEVDKLPAMEKVCLVAQTTQDEKKFAELAAAVRHKFPGAEIFNTICESTRRRQREVMDLAHKVQAMVVVGGKGSGNTRRLAKIAEETGIPTFHVETEEELDLKKLSQFSEIGVTAGASTPNWLILKVVERLKSLSEPRRISSFIEKLARFFTISYLLLACGAGFLTLASMLIQGLTPQLSWPIIAALYVFSMHVLNRLADKPSERFNQPGRTEFYERYGQIMIGAGILSAMAALLLTWYQGILPFFLLLAISGLGLLYNIPLLPRHQGSLLRYQKLKDIPGSKTIFVALAWGMVTSLLPPLAQEGTLRPAAYVAFLFSTILVFVRTTLYDFKDIQGDLLVGKETIPIVLGRRKTQILTVSLLFLLGGVLILAPLLKWTSPITFFFLISLAYVVIYYFLYRKQILGQGFLFEGVVDGSLIFAGFLGLIWFLLN